MHWHETASIGHECESESEETVEIEVEVEIGTECCHSGALKEEKVYKQLCIQCLAQ